MQSNIYIIILHINIFDTLKNYAFGNKNLSTVVRTQNNLWAKIPIINVTTKVLQNVHFVIQHIKYTNKIVNTTSIMAIFNIL